jgi:hypothetical protein
MSTLQFDGTKDSIEIPDSADFSADADFKHKALPFKSKPHDGLQKGPRSLPGKRVIQMQTDQPVEALRYQARSAAGTTRGDAP